MKIPHRHSRLSHAMRHWLPGALLVATLALPQARAEVPPAIDEAAAAGQDTPEAAATHEPPQKATTNQKKAGSGEPRVAGRVQARYTYEDPAGADYESAFMLPRARLAVKGKAFDSTVSYLFQADFGKGFVTLKDYFVDYRAAQSLRVRIGQFKRPFSRQQITSSGRQALVDRSITDKAFGAGRDIGLLIHNDYEKSPTFEYAVGVFNGSGDKSRFSADVDVEVDGTDVSARLRGGKFSNVTSRFLPTLAARVGYNHGGIKGYSEADLEGGGLRFAVAGSVIANLDLPNEDESSLLGQIDYIVKAHGFSSTGAVYFASAQDGKKASKQDLDDLGFHAQVGYLLFEKLQPALRYARLIPQRAGNASVETQELAASTSVYFHGHRLKWQTDVGAQTRKGGDRDYVVRSQLQLVF